MTQNPGLKACSKNFMSGALSRQVTDSASVLRLRPSAELEITDMQYREDRYPGQTEALYLGKHT